jgi:hypothetical protein
MSQTRRKHGQIDDQGILETRDDFVPPALAAIAERTLAAIDIVTAHREKLRAAEQDFRAATRTVAAAGQAVAAPHMSALGPKVIALSDAKVLRDAAAAAIETLTKQVSDGEQELSALQDELCKAASEFLNPKRAAAAAKLRNAATELKAFRNEYVALSSALDADLAVMAHAMRVYLPDLESNADLLYSPQVPDCPPSLALVRRAIRGARLAFGP